MEEDMTPRDEYTLENIFLVDAFIDAMEEEDGQ